MKAKVTLELDTAEDQLEIALLSKGVAMWCAMQNLSNAYRSKEKYAPIQETTWEEVREIFYSHMSKYMDLGE